jgi:hypothetical protein
MCVRVHPPACVCVRACGARGSTVRQWAIAGAAGLAGSVSGLGLGHPTGAIAKRPATGTFRERIVAKKKGRDCSLPYR